MLNKIKRLNPEKNALVRSTLYVIGIGGFIHLSTLLLIAIVRQDYTYFNPFYAVDIDQLLPSVKRSIWLFIFGWISTMMAIYTIYKKINRKS